MNNSDEEKGASVRHRIIVAFIIILIFGAVICGIVTNELNERTRNRSEYDHVIIIGIDGAGAFFKETETPAFDSYFQNGAITYQMAALPPTMSAQGWGSLFYGVEPKTHGISNEVAERVTYQNDDLLSLYRIISDAKPEAENASICAWSAINYGIIDERDKLYRFPSNKAAYISDDEVLSACIQYLDDHNPTLMFVHFNSVDDAGHSNGFGSKEYLEAIRQLDMCLKKLFELIDGKFDMKRTLVILTTDHGGTLDGYHGGCTLPEVMSMFAIKGHSVISNGLIKDMELRDIAPIVLSSLGIEIPQFYTGRIPEGIFDGIGGGDRPSGTAENPSEKYRFHSTIPTPELPDDLSLVKKIVYRNTFDNLIGDEKTAETISTHGYYGNASDFSSYGLSTGVAWNKDWENLSVSFWIKARPTTGDPVIAGNKNWNSGKNQGFILAFQRNGIKCNIADKDGRRFDVQFPLPSDFFDGWTHYLFIINRNEYTITGFCDFEKLFVEDIDNTQIDLESCLSDTPIMIGQDASGNYNYSLPAMIDDFMVFNDAITETEIEQLKEYYDIIL